MGQPNRIAVPEMEHWLGQMRSWLSDMEKQADEIARAVNLGRFQGRQYLSRHSEAENYYRDHGINTAVYAALIARELEYPLAETRLLTLSALVHDVGNVYIPTALLEKPGLLSAEEMLQVRRHTQLGSELLKTLGAADEVVRVALEHHERIDGSGYPFGVDEGAIHPFSRLCGVADAYAALTSSRPYGPAFAPERAAELVKGLGAQFDTKIVDHLARIERF